jgi:hypothetical protein
MHREETIWNVLNHKPKPVPSGLSAMPYFLPLWASLRRVRISAGSTFRCGVALLVAVPHNEVAFWHGIAQLYSLELTPMSLDSHPQRAISSVERARIRVQDTATETFELTLPIPGREMRKLMQGDANIESVNIIRLDLLHCSAHVLSLW